MARHNRLTVLNIGQAIGMIPVFYHGDFHTALNITHACIAGGAKVVEFVNRGPSALEVFSKLESASQKDFPDAILGVGSIVDAPTAALFIAAGANFIVGPCFDHDVATLCNKRKIPYMPGCATVTEIHQAHAAGVEICKLFPGGEVGGPSFVKAVLGPMPFASLMPTGGVSPTRESLTAWFDAGITMCGMGSKLITKEIIATKNYDALTQTVKETIAIIQALKKDNK